MRLPVRVRLFCSLLVVMVGLSVLFALRYVNSSPEGLELQQPFCGIFFDSDLDSYLDDVVYSTDNDSDATHFLDSGSHYVCFMKDVDGTVLRIEGSSLARSLAPFYDYYHLVDGDNSCEDCYIEKDDIDGVVRIGEYDDYQIRVAWIKGDSALEIKLDHPYPREEQPKVALELMRLVSVRAPQLLTARGYLPTDTPAPSPAAPPGQG